MRITFTSNHTGGGTQGNTAYLEQAVEVAVRVPDGLSSIAGARNERLVVDGRQRDGQQAMTAGTGKEKDKDKDKDLSGQLNAGAWPTKVRRTHR